MESEKRHDKKVVAQILGGLCSICIVAVVAGLLFAKQKSADANRSASQLFSEYAYQDPAQSIRNDEFAIRMARCPTRSIRRQKE